MKFRFFLMMLLPLLLVPTARAQGGCVNSPECPTALLAAVGIASAAFMRRLKK